MRQKVFVLRILQLTILAAFAGRADAVLVHQYKFNEGATADASSRVIIDSVGGANGVVRGAGSSATADQLILNGGSSATAAYVDLPNGIISGLTDATFEAWYTISTPFSWGRVFDFGSTDTSTTPPATSAPQANCSGRAAAAMGKTTFFMLPSAAPTSRSSVSVLPIKTRHSGAARRVISEQAYIPI